MLAPMMVSALDQAGQDYLRQRSILRRFGTNQIIQQRGEKADGIWWIESGSVMVGQYLPDGEFRSLALLGPGDSYGELALFSGRPRVVDAVARENSELLFVPGRAIDSLFHARPATMRIMLGAMGQQLQEMLDVVAGIRRGTSLARVAGMIANLGGDADPGETISITQQELAELLGLTRATVNIALGELEAEGVIRRSYGKVTILDPATLRLASLD